jgi:hypothetical protein
MPEYGPERKPLGLSCESFFKTLKRKLETPDAKHSAGDVRQPVSMYPYVYYNRIWLHSALNYPAPNVFNQWQAA